MGAAIGVFEGARALCVPRSRFVPVKTTDDLLALRSDVYRLLRRRPRRERSPSRRTSRSTRRTSSAIADFEARFPHGPAVAAALHALRRPRRRHASGAASWRAGRVEVCADVPDDTMLSGVYRPAVETLTVSTGQPREDAKIAFDKERRRRALSRLASRMRFEADDVSHMLPFEEVVAALGATSRVAAGEQVIPLDAIVGTVDRRRGEFDRSFRPSPNTRGRWERIAEARKRGEAMPPIDVFQIGDLYFVQDGHHRVSVARAMGDKDINANVVEVRTKLGADRELQMSDLPLKRHERVFHERVPLPPAMRERIQLSDEWRYAQLATLIESWGYRAGARARARAGPPRARAALVPRGVRADGRDAARGRDRRRRHRDRALPARRDAALPAAAAPRLVARTWPSGSRARSSHRARARRRTR